MNSKRYKLLEGQSKKSEPLSFDKLLPLVKKNCTAKFQESIDLSFQINVKQKKIDINIRTIVDLPSGTGKKIKVAVICEEEKLEEAKKSGADIIGSDDLINKISAGDINFAKDAGADIVGSQELIDDISQGNINFDLLVATPDMMPKLAKLGRVLGPKGLMPNPKLGTVTNNIAKSVTAAKAGQAEIKNDKDGNIGLTIGKKNFSDEKLIKNFNAVIDVLEKEKPSAVKGNLIKSAFITSTMGISYKLKLSKNI